MATRVVSASVKTKALAVRSEPLCILPQYIRIADMQICDYVQLPIDSSIPEILRNLRESNNLAIEAPPGAGKTTRVPPALLDLDPRGVLVLEPRRLAARLAARFVAAERGESVGQTVGYQVRFEEVAGPQTRLRFVTEGVLTRMLLSNPKLDGVASVVLDEFHERHLEGDLALALLRRLQRTARPDLRLIAMSATLDAAPVAQFLDAPVVRSEGRQYPLEIEYTPHSAAPLEEQVYAALERWLLSRRSEIHERVLGSKPRAGFPARGRGDPPRAERLRRARQTARMPHRAASRRSDAGRAGSWQWRLRPAAKLCWPPMWPKAPSPSKA